MPFLPTASSGASWHDFVKFSQNWKKQKARLNRIHTKIANCRHDFLHQHSTAISKNHAIICVEDLQVCNVTVQVVKT
jgi:putative transposase